MALNPLAYTEKVVRSLFRYQLTAYPFTDGDWPAVLYQALAENELVYQVSKLHGPATTGGA